MVTFKAPESEQRDQRESSGGVSAPDGSAGGHPQRAPEYQLYVSRDHLYVMLDCPDPHANVSRWVQQILIDFGNLEIPEYPDADRLEQILLSACEPGEHILERPIMMGVAPTPTRPGRVEWARDFFAQGWQEDEVTGAINFWEKLEHHAVNQGETLARLHNPVPGITGLNVFGHEIPVSQPEKIKMRAGKNVQAQPDEDGTTYTATCDGHIRHIDNILSVDDVFVIQGNVSLETGNIHHTGTVIIHGDVSTGATVNADGDIMVKGLVEPCHLKCGGDLTVNGGIVGEDGYEIEIAGNLTARYITEANIKADGDVLVTNEVAHSTLMCNGQVKLPKGRITGGLTMGFQGISVAEAGSSGSTGTRLVAGMDYQVHLQTAGPEENIRKMENDRNQLQEMLSQGSEKRNPTAREIKDLNKLKRKFNLMEQAIAEEQTVIEKIKMDSPSLAAGKEEIIVHKELWSGTSITLGTAKTVVRQSILKPRLIQKRRGQVKIMPMGEGNTPEQD